MPVKRSGAMIRYALAIWMVLPAGGVLAQCNNYSITVLGGIFPAQVSWQFVDAGNTVVASGGPNVSVPVCLPGGCYTMRMFDSANDGWNYAGYWIRAQPTNTVVASGTLTSGGSGQHTISLGTGCGGAPCTTHTFSVTAGSSPGQIGWNLVNGATVVASGTAPATVSLCLAPGCYTVQLFDSGNNGWNGATWTLTNSMGLTVQSGTLASGSLNHAVIPLGVAPLTCTGAVTVDARDCTQAVNVCGNMSFLTWPNGPGGPDIPPVGSLGNPYMEYNDGEQSAWGTDNWGCFQSGEINPTWMLINIAGSGSLQFTFGAQGVQGGYYDWILYPYSSTACGAIAAGTVAPIRCNWNHVPWGGTGMTNTVPPGGNWANFEPPLNVLAGQRYLLCFSNHTSTTAEVPLVFSGTAVVGCPILLPVELLSFTATPEDRTVRVNWITASEQNSSHFEVQRSVDAQNWSTIDRVEAAGHSVQTIAYSTRDIAPLPGLSYYRLHMVDLDGSEDYSAVAAVRMDITDDRPWPNPSDGTFWVKSPGEVRIHDPAGRLVAFQLLQRTDEAVELRVEQPGIYYVSCPAQPGAPACIVVQ